MVKVLLITPFKSGSTTALHVLKKCFGYASSWCKKDLLWKKKYDEHVNFVLKCHSRKLHCNNYVPYHFDVIITIVRIPTSVYISAFFQDIEHSGFSYYVGPKEKVLSLNKHKLLSHFLSHDWSAISQCSYDENFAAIEKYTGVNIWDKTFNKHAGYSIYNVPNKNQKIIVLTIETLDKLSDILHEAGIKKYNTNNAVPKATTVSANISSDKWYNEKYKQVKGILPPDYYKLYEKEDNKIKQHFY